MNKNAIIIGGTSGIGLHTARYLRDAGYKVLIGGRNAPEDESGIDYLKIDVTNESSIEQFFRSIPFQHIDSMIYAAGITTIKKRLWANYIFKWKWHFDFCIRINQFS